jgi:anti-sigma-K factor RskA
MLAMSEVNGMNCAEFGDVAAELALGVLTGRERADALAHLDHCDACREHVQQLTATGEELLSLLPSSEPPPGFETRVMERLGLTGAGPRQVRDLREKRRHRTETERPFGTINRGTRRILAAAAVVVAVVAAALGGWGLHGTAATSASKPGLSSVALLSADHENVGEVFVYNGDPRWLYMSVDLDSGTGTVLCQLVSSDGRVTTVGSFRLNGGYGSWGSPAWVGDGTPVGARLIKPDGTVLASATFPKAAIS